MPTAVHDLQDKLTRFLTEELSRKDARMIVKIELEHAPQGCRAEQIKDWTREDNAEWFDLAYVERLAAECIEMAEERADLYRMGENVFKLRAYQHIGTRKAYAFKMLPVHDGDESAIVGTSHMGDANATGVLAMQMRNNEFLTRANRDMMMGTISSLTGQVKDLLQELKEVRQENRELVRQANMDKASEAERELAVVRQAHIEGRKDLLTGKVVSLLPIAASRLLEKTTGGAAGAAPSALPSILSELGASLAQNPQRMAAIGAALSVEERALLGEAMRLANAAKDANAATAAKPQPQQNVKPEGGQAPTSNGVNPGASTT